MLNSQVPKLRDEADKPHIKIKNYNDWKSTEASSNDKYGHYAEYVILCTILNMGRMARKATDKEDSPGGGDIMIYTTDKRGIFIDSKLSEPRFSMTYEITGKNTADFLISNTDVERLRSENEATQIMLVECLSSLANEMSGK